MVALLAALMFAINAGMYIGAPGIESLFLTRFGFEYLPRIYLLLGLLTAAVTLGIGILVSRVSQRLIYRLLPFALGALLVGGWFLIPLEQRWLYPVLYLLMYILFTLQNMVAWGTAGMVCETRQAKRLFSLFAAGAILGSSLGGLVTPLLVRVTGAANLILVWAGSLWVGGVLVALVTSGVRDARSPSGRRRSGLLARVMDGYRQVKGSKFLRWFAGVAFLSGVLYYILNYPFSREKG